MNTRLLERRSSRQNEDVSVDPRIAARRESVRQDRSRRRNRVLAAVAALLVVIGALWLISRTALFDVDQIRVSGTSRLQIDEVVAASGITVEQPLLGLDAGAAAGRLEQQPWIQSAEVESSWGGDITISVVERIPVGVVLTEDGASQLVDGTGALLGEVSEADGVLPRITSVTEGTLELASLLPPGVRSRVTEVRSDAEGRLQLVLRPAGTVEFGPANALQEKVASLVTVMGQVDQKDLCTIRVITPDTPVVTRTPICG
jgi:cell division protein FtsQ